MGARMQPVTLRIGALVRKVHDKAVPEHLKREACLAQVDNELNLVFAISCESFVKAWS
jgi:hypothetical protein